MGTVTAQHQLTVAPAATVTAALARQDAQAELKTALHCGQHSYDNVEQEQKSAGLGSTAVGRSSSAAAKHTMSEPAADTHCTVIWHCRIDKAAQDCNRAHH
jgi:hypothetical protein